LGAGDSGMGQKKAEPVSRSACFFEFQETC